MTNLVALALAATLLFCGCAITPYRSADLAKHNEKCLAHPKGGDFACAVRHQIGPERDAPFITYVEFDDQGSMLARQEAMQALQELRERARAKPTLIVAFAHGWKHNASVDSGNVAQFQTLLGKLQKSFPGWQVEGVYLGWRGKSAGMWGAWGARELTFWTRKAAGTRVGTDGLIEVVSELAQIRAQKLADTDKQHVFVMAGHSFGGMAAFYATRHLLMRELVEAQNSCICKTGVGSHLLHDGKPRLSFVPFGPVEAAVLPAPSDASTLSRPLAASACRCHGSLSSSVADLIVIVNPAFETVRFDPLLARSKQAEFQAGQLPILTVFMSKGDRATKNAFPFARAFTTLLKTYVPGQRKRDIVALGHLQESLTHRLALAGETASGKSPALKTNEGETLEMFIPPSSHPAGLEEGFVQWNKDQDAWRNFLCGHAPGWANGDITLERIQARDTSDAGTLPRSAQRKESHNAPFSPYLIVSVDERLIPGHSDVWKPGFLEFVANMVKARFLTRPGCPPASRGALGTAFDGGTWNMGGIDGRQNEPDSPTGVRP
ncbi:hypothetical protein [Pseudoxanthomonas mexicana]|uniref:hypothetical protein n=1 Tax=Pseudoxanthomonas mexicana TaxID=128785 RepID=UPI00398BB6CF